MKQNSEFFGNLKSKKEYAAGIGKSERTVDKWIKRGMRVVRIGGTVYIDPAVALQWFADGMPEPEPVRRRRRAAFGRPE